MKKEYESPLFELQRFNFMDVMTGATTPLMSSDGEVADYQAGVGSGNQTGADTDSSDWW